ncbi:hypothetical protein CkaCkLH20_05568 [Colletotrichum karsti]|uniref:Uncharacterized protein n=1 Tax=Colletotrichum karsti TaxID=1095194 RepID=A0A9P6LLL9_9PEZI|nr:uncharacterized protein CkaCkLH20_05568 [Colletotrichum karsti]KAF9876722.1 hypothetical protein CkaCkLH20_05568 [Colletotrichum karsti]
MHLTQWALATVSLVSLAFGQTCYWPSGSTASALQPCSISSGNEVAACCFANHYCMTNGLCLSPTEGTWYRGGCTDKEYKKTGCPEFCHTSDIVGGIPGRHAAVWACASKVFACSSLDNCAKQNFTAGIYRAVMNRALQTDLANDTASATATATATATGTEASSTEIETEEASTTTCPADAQVSPGISTGAAAGIGIGVGLPLAIAVAALTIMLLREKKKAREAVAASYQQQSGYGQQPYTITPSPWGKQETDYVPAAEVSGQSMPELDSSVHGRHELSH